MVSMRKLLGLAVTGTFSTTLGACFPDRDTTPALYTQYAIAEPVTPEGVACFYDCLRTGEPEARAVCLAQCDGAYALVTTEPCSSSAPRLCTSDPIRPPEPAPESADGAGSQVVGGILSIVSAALTHEDDCDHAEASSSHQERATPRRAERAEPTERTEHPSTADLLRHSERKYTVARPHK
jgi:hypothetical protein